MTAYLLQTALALGIVILLILAVAFVYRKKKGDTAGLIGLLAYQSLGPRKGVAALKVGKDVLVVGVTATDLRLLASMKEEDLSDPAAGIAEKVERLKRIRERLDG